jgi:hypothetical protein
MNRPRMATFSSNEEDATTAGNFLYDHWELRIIQSTVFTNKLLYLDGMPYPCLSFDASDFSPGIIYITVDKI